MHRATPLLLLALLLSLAHALSREEVLQTVTNLKTSLWRRHDFFELSRAAAPASALSTTSMPRPPVVVIPGLMGSQIEFRRVPGRAVPEPCESLPADGSWVLIWMSVTSMLQTSLLECFLLTFHAECSPDEVDVLGFPHCGLPDAGVQYRPVDYGGLRGVDYSARTPSGPAMPYWAHVLDGLRSAGWPEDRLYGHPFLWHLAPATMAQDMQAPMPEGWEGSDFDRLRKLVEGAAGEHGQKVLLMGHSMGGMTAMLFMKWMELQPEGNQWIEKYVGGQILVAPAVAGSAESLIQLVGGFPLAGVYGNRAMYRYWSDFSCFHALAFVPECVDADRPVIRHGSREYTQSVFAQLIDEINGERTGLIHAHFRNGMHTIYAYAPPVRTHIIAARDRETPASFMLKVSTDAAQRDRIVQMTGVEPGDGSVPYDPLLRWIRAAQKAARERWQEDERFRYTMAVTDTDNHLHLVAGPVSAREVIMPAIIQIINEKDADEWNFNS